MLFMFVCPSLAPHTLLACCALVLLFPVTLCAYFAFDFLSFLCFAFSLLSCRVYSVLFALNFIFMGFLWWFDDP